MATISLQLPLVNLPGSAVSGLTAGSILIADDSGVLSENNANLFYDAVNSRVGINTSSPTVPLQVVGGNVNLGNGVAQACFSGSDNECGIVLENTGPQGRKWQLISTNLYSAFNGAGNFVIADSTGSGTYLVMTHTGKLGFGIGMLEPTANLDVVGTGNFSGNLSAATMTPANGASGCFTTADSKTVTVANGIITSIV